MQDPEGTSQSGMDWDAIRREADAAAREFLDKDWGPYLAKVEKIEARPDNQNGADKSWVERALAIHRAHLRSVLRAR